MLPFSFAPFSPKCPLPCRRCFFMNTLQKEDVASLRQEGYSYRAIADYTGLTYDAVKSYCKRQKLTRVQEHENLPERSFCRECGKEVPLLHGHRRRKFCSDECRMEWWKAHRNLVKRKTLKAFQCAHCGKTFYKYPAQKQRYCSRECYLEER